MIDRQEKWDLNRRVMLHPTCIRRQTPFIAASVAFNDPSTRIHIHLPPIYAESTLNATLTAYHRYGIIPAYRTLRSTIDRTLFPVPVSPVPKADWLQLP